MATRAWSPAELGAATTRRARPRPSLSAHWRTLAPHVSPRAFLPCAGPRPQRLRIPVDDPDVGRVWLSGDLCVPRGARDLVVLVHGLGGSARSSYLRTAVGEANRLELASLCLSLRGADRRGDDFYNIALTADLHAALACAELAPFERVYLLGYSMGGHVALTYACEAGDERVRAVAALCTPLDLSIEQQWFDTHCHPLYRRHVLGGLKEIYAAVARRRPVPSDPALVAAVRTVHEWDRLTIAPRYGFDSPEDYYAELSVGPRLGRLRRPALLLAAEDDPLVPRDAILDPLAGMGRMPERLELRWVPRAGHVAFPRDLVLGRRGPRGLVAEVVEWMRARDDS